MTVPTLVATAIESNTAGPLLMLGPSLGTSSAVLWEPVIPALAERYRIVAWDLPGHGASPATTAPYTIEELADGVVAILDELGVSQALYAGVSIGGATGLALGIRHPGRFSKLAILASAAKIGTPEGWIDRAAMVRAQSTSPLVIGSAQRWFAPGVMEEHPVIAGRLLHNLQDADDESYALACEALRDFDVIDQLGRIDVPVLALYGDHDETTPQASAEQIAAGVQDGRAALIAGSAHLPPANQPAATTRELLAFLG